MPKSVAIPPGWDVSPSQGYPQQYVSATYLYTWVKRDSGAKVLVYSLRKQRDGGGRARLSEPLSSPVNRSATRVSRLKYSNILFIH